MAMADRPESHSLKEPEVIRILVALLFVQFHEQNGIVGDDLLCQVSIVTLCLRADEPLHVFDRVFADLQPMLFCQVSDFQRQRIQMPGGSGRVESLNGQGSDSIIIDQIDYGGEYLFLLLFRPGALISLDEPFPQVGFSEYRDGHILSSGVDPQDRDCFLVHII